MKISAFYLIFLAGIVRVQSGGYILKGGVVDFQRPLDYMQSAVYAGKMAWSQKLEEDQNAGRINSARNVRQTPYIPTFYTSGQSGFQQKKSRNGFLSKFRPQRTPFSQPLFYNNYRRRGHF